MNDAIRMQLSAFVDGELPENEAEMLLRRMSQDDELRREVAEYLALSRLIKGEAGLAGADRLHARVADEIENRPAADIDTPDSASGSRAIRPLAGFAIAATVALLAIFGLQRSDSIDSADAAPPVSTQAAVVPDPESQQEQQRYYFLNHANASSQLGANGMNSRLVTLRFSEEVAEESDTEVAEDDATDDVDAAEAPTTQPQ